MVSKNAGFVTHGRAIFNTWLLTGVAFGQITIAGRLTRFVSIKAVPGIGLWTLRLQFSVSSSLELSPAIISWKTKVKTLCIAAKHKNTIPYRASSPHPVRLVMV